MSNDQLTGPYNFVPLGDKVYTPQWQEQVQVSHDIPMEDGISGYLDLKLHNQTPLLIGKHEQMILPYNKVQFSNKNKQPEPGANYQFSLIKPFKIDGRYCIPGSSIKGMVRSVMEIASYGKFSFIDRNYQPLIKNKNQVSIGDLLNRNAEQLAAEENKGLLDLAELIFGQAADDDEQVGLKSRVRIGHFSYQKHTAMELVQFVSKLASPKPTFFPNYVRQPRDKKTAEPINYDHADAQIAGWKRYFEPDRKKDQTIEKPTPYIDGQPLPTPEQDAILMPLPQGMELQGRIYFHNLNSIELGALCWVLFWGKLSADNNLKINTKGPYHRLGMGKPYGWGSCWFELCGGAFENLNESADQEPKALTRHFIMARINDFEKNMTAFDKNWRASQQLESLIKMATIGEVEQTARYPYLSDKKKNPKREFAEAKKGKLKLPTPWL